LKNEFTTIGRVEKAGEEITMLSIEGSGILVTLRTQGVAFTGGYAYKDKGLGILRRGWQRSLYS
jgi:hypothetical protein